ncbi:unnamed protein product [Amoebophrya sp. A120]|nr:unnamed protein product [Amoebophrya sp. A120]|eukprot:GSA120T00011281001.1
MSTSSARDSARADLQQSPHLTRWDVEQLKRIFREHYHQNLGAGDNEAEARGAARMTARVSVLPSVGRTRGVAAAPLVDEPQIIVPPPRGRSRSPPLSARHADASEGTTIPLFGVPTDIQPFRGLLARAAAQASTERIGRRDESPAPFLPSLSAASTRASSTDTVRIGAEAPGSGSDVVGTSSSGRGGATTSSATTTSAGTTQEEVCAICYDEKANQVFFPCGHMCACAGCAVRGMPRGECPICRQRITGRAQLRPAGAPGGSS